MSLFGVVQIGSTEGPRIIHSNNTNTELHEVTFHQLSAHTTFTVYLLPNAKLSVARVACIYIDDVTLWTYSGYMSNEVRSALINVYGRGSVTLRIVITPQTLFLEQAYETNRIKSSQSSQLLAQVNSLLAYNSVVMYLNNRLSKEAKEKNAADRIASVVDAATKTNSKLTESCMQARSLAKSHLVDLERQCVDFLTNAPPNMLTTADQMIHWADQELNRIDRLMLHTFTNIHNTLSAANSIRLQNARSTEAKQDIINQMEEETKRKKKLSSFIIGVYELVQDKYLDRIQEELSDELLQKRKSLNLRVTENIEKLRRIC